MIQENLPVELAYNKGTIRAPRNSRITIYHKRSISIDGFLVDSDRDAITIIKPYYPWHFDEGKMFGKEAKIRKSEILGFALYPEATILETKGGK